MRLHGTSHRSQELSGNSRLHASQLHSFTNHLHSHFEQIFGFQGFGWLVVVVVVCCGYIYYHIFTYACGSGCVSFLNVIVVVLVAGLKWFSLVTPLVFKRRFFMFFHCFLRFLIYTGICLIQDLNDLARQLQVFSAEEAECFCCSCDHVHPETGSPLPCDRDLVLRTMTHWFASCEESFMFPAVWN